MQKTGTSLSESNQASSSFAQSHKLSHTATQMEQNKESTSASLKKDLGTMVAQRLIDTMGTQRGMDAFLNDKGMVERTAQQILSEQKGTMHNVDVGTEFKDTSSHLANNGTHAVDTSSPLNVDVNGAYSNYNSDVSVNGNNYLNNMPETQNAPTIPTDGIVEGKVQSNHLDHSSASIALMANPTMSIIDSAVDTGKELVKDANFKVSADGTYTDRNGGKHNWANKKRTEH